jgi:uncharacterized protein
VVVAGVAEGGKTPLLAIGEAKWGEVMDIRHAKRLQQVRSLLAAIGRYDVSETKLMCFSGAGFSESLREMAASDAGLMLVGASDLYDFPVIAP